MPAWHVMGQPLPLPQQRLRQTRYATLMGNGSIIVTKTMKNIYAEITEIYLTPDTSKSSKSRLPNSQSES
jgi:hypothetical protein